MQFIKLRFLSFKLWVRWDSSQDGFTRIRARATTPPLSSQATALSLYLRRQNITHDAHGPVGWAHPFQYAGWSSITSSAVNGSMLIFFLRVIISFTYWGAYLFAIEKKLAGNSFEIVFLYSNEALAIWRSFPFHTFLLKFVCCRSQSVFQCIRGKPT